MNHRRLRCYELLMCVARRLPAIIKSMLRGSYYLEDQLKRVLSSAVLNLSEGNGRRSIKERNRFFDISMASIAETSAAIDLVAAYGYIPACLQVELRDMLSHAYAIEMKLRR